MSPEGLVPFRNEGGVSRNCNSNFVDEIVGVAAVVIIVVVCAAAAGGGGEINVLKKIKGRGTRRDGAVLVFCIFCSDFVLFQLRISQGYILNGSLQGLKELDVLQHLRPLDVVARFDRREGSGRR